MSRIFIGQRIRERRRSLGMAQRTLADTLGISTAYLSLIENDKRLVAGRLLQRIAEALDVPLEFVSASRDARLADELAELTGSLGLASLAGKPATELASRNPEWARTLIGINRALVEARDTARAMADRLNRDPELVELSHRTLTEITAIRSAAEILAQYPNLSNTERQRFVDIIATSSDQLSVSARAMLDMLEGADALVEPGSPAREVEDFIIDHHNHFAQIEDAAPSIFQALPNHGLGLSAVLAARLEDKHAMTVRRIDSATTTPEDRTIIALPAGAPEPTVRFRLAQAVAARELSDVIETIVAGASFSSQAARQRASAALARYGAAAILMPYEPFGDIAQTSRHDFLRLQNRFNASFEQVAHRLVTLRRPGAEGIPFAFVRADPAGNISKRFSLPGLYMPQFGGACPLWPLYGAFAAAGRLVVQKVEMSDERRFIFLARMVRKGAPAIGAPEAHFTVMLACEVQHGARIVHADPVMEGPPVAAGWECRSCPRHKCPQRAHPSLQTVPAAHDTAMPDSGAFRSSQAVK